MVTARFDLPATASQVAPARHRVRQQLDTWGQPLDEATTTTVELIVSELVTNAIVHAQGSRIGLALQIASRPGRRRLRVEVSDGGHHLPGRARPATDDVESGRGLALVEALSVRSGAIPEAHGKTCWAEVDLPEAS
ncbi:MULTISPECIES: ATP-binding protein [unclassified Streptomyces]|uniref:ATP-binding protein n=1 Tax=unclassified Streptomyces TaxID=2593676 RepID=UPI0013A6AFB9|nr:MULTISPECIES: ATP-binding protein [unclassified Streptomyces]